MLGLNLSNVLLIAALIGGGFAGFHLGHWRGHGAGREVGRAEIVREVERRNAAAAETAREARSRVRDCDASGGEWDQEAGACIREVQPGVKP